MDYPASRSGYPRTRSRSPPPYAYHGSHHNPSHRRYADDDAEFAASSSYDRRRPARYDGEWSSRPSPRSDYHGGYYDDERGYYRGRGGGYGGRGGGDNYHRPESRFYGRDWPAAGQGGYRHGDEDRTSRYHQAAPRHDDFAMFSGGGSSRRNGGSRGESYHHHHHHSPTAPASSYEPILCPRYNWTQPDCQEPSCTHVHVCRNWLGGECSRADCRLSHSLADDHNWPKFQGWLSEQELAEFDRDRSSPVINHRLRAWLFGKLPKICPSSLVPRLVCHSQRCRDLHVCVNIVKSGQCRYRHHCASPYHDLFMPRNLDVLRRYYPSISAYVDPARPLEEQAWLSDVLKNDMDKPAPAGFDERHFKLRGLTIDTVQLCLNYGEGRGECTEPGCRDLHVCRAWLGGGCPNGRSCHWVHGFTDDVVQRLEKLVDDDRRLDCQYNIRDNLKVVFPCTCCYYNTERGCERGANGCDYLHLCNELLRGKDCRCARNHDPFKFCVAQRLARKGVDTAEKANRVLLRNVLFAELRAKQPCPVCSGGRRSGSHSRSPGRSRSRRRSRSGSERHRARRRRRSRSNSRSVASTSGSRPPSKKQAAPAAIDSDDAGADSKRRRNKSSDEADEPGSDDWRRRRRASSSSSGDGEASDSDDNEDASESNVRRHGRK